MPAGRTNIAGTTDVLVNSSFRHQPLPVIDYLRGIAAMGVVVYHARVPLWVGFGEIASAPERYSAFDHTVAWLSVPTPLLGSLVMLFFVISGSCVHLPQAGSVSPLDLRKYIVRRFFRIYSPYLAAVVLTALLEWAGPSGLPETSVRRSLDSMLMVQNYTAFGDTLGPGQLPANPSLWSPPVEMELYAVYP